LVAGLDLFWLRLILSNLFHPTKSISKTDSIYKSDPILSHHHVLIRLVSVYFVILSIHLAYKLRISVLVLSGMFRKLSTTFLFTSFSENVIITKLFVLELNLFGILKFCTSLF
jgi:hypothetical protein